MAHWKPYVSGVLAFVSLLAHAGDPCSAPDLERSRVAEVYPSAAELPQNLLRLYVYFTQPMER
ncbi:MAG: hypothetical protein AAFX85_12075, partial [Pseudomonadota bacterium]